VPKQRRSTAIDGRLGLLEGDTGGLCAVRHLSFFWQPFDLVNSLDVEWVIWQSAHDARGRGVVFEVRPG
jgi:hypothetical protein